MTSPVALALAMFFGLSQSGSQAPAQQPPPPAQEKSAAPAKAPAKSDAPAKAPAKKPKRVFTNDEVDGIAPRSRESAPAEEESTDKSSKKKTTTAKSDGTGKRPEETREYYDEKLVPLRTELYQVDSELSSARYKPEYDPQTGRPIISHSKQNEVERLERRKADIQKKIAGICEEAARNNVSASGC